MHLWQIRHNPNRPQTLLKLTILASAFAVIAASLFPQARYVIAQTKEGAADKAASDSKPSPAAEFLERVRQELPKHRSIQADLSQAVSIGEQQFKVTGQYISAPANPDGNPLINKLRLSYSVIPDQGVRGEMLEVCDGKELWTQLTLPDSKRVTRRNVQHILAAAVAANKRNVPESSVSAELGIGGVTALLASLDRTMSFEAIRTENNEGNSRTIIQGRWKKEFAVHFPKDKDDNLPALVPDLVRLYINTETLFPERLLYLKKQPQKKTFKSLVSIDFSNVVFDGPVNDADFVYKLPEDAVPEDVTKQYIERIAAPAAEAPAGK